MKSPHESLRSRFWRENKTGALFAAMAASHVKNEEEWEDDSLKIAGVFYFYKKKCTLDFPFFCTGCVFFLSLFYSGKAMG